MIKALVLGGTGMLGHMVVRTLSETGSVQVSYTNHSNHESPFFLNVETDYEQLNKITNNCRYDFIINCVGITSYDIIKNDFRSINSIIKVNSIFPHYLAEIARKKAARVIQISTDGVFSGRSGYYIEDSLHDCVDVYGKTKSLGEVKYAKFLNIRCSIIGPDSRKHRGLLEWFLAQPNGSTVEGYVDYLWNGVTSLQFSQLCKIIITKDKFEDILCESPIHHFCPNDAVSKYELLEIFKSVFARNIEIVPCKRPEGKVNRILQSNFNSLRQIYGDAQSMVKAVADLSDFMG